MNYLFEGIYFVCSESADWALTVSFWINVVLFRANEAFCSLNTPGWVVSEVWTQVCLPGQCLRVRRLSWALGGEEHLELAYIFDAILARVLFVVRVTWQIVTLNVSPLSLFGFISNHRIDNQALLWKLMWVAECRLVKLERVVVLLRLWVLPSFRPDKLGGVAVGAQVQLEI